MGLWDSIKKLYRSWEDRWYAFLDGLDGKGIPVYSVIEPLDKVIPSFMLVLVLALGILIFGVSLLVGPFGAPVDLTVLVQDDAGNPLAGATVILNGTTVSTNGLGEALLRGVNSGTVSVKVSADGFEDQTAEFAVDAQHARQTVNMVPLEETITFSSKTIYIVDSDGVPLRSSASLRFACENNEANAPDSITLSRIDGGKATVSVPSNCGRLNVTVYGDGFGTESGSLLGSESSTTIYLASAGGPTEGMVSLLVQVKSETDQPLSGIRVTLADSGRVRVDEDTTVNGQAQFSVRPGTYTMGFYDPQGTFQEKESSVVIDGSETSVTKTITLTQGPAGNIKIRVADKDTHDPIEDAEITLRNRVSGQELPAQLTDSDGLATFSVMTDTDYTAFVKADGYVLLEEPGMRVSERTHTLELEPCTPQTCGALKVKIVDQDGFPVEAARVALFNADNPQNAYLTGYDSVLSDINGIAKFEGVDSGIYYAYAFKEANNGQSDSKYFNAGNQQSGQDPYTVVMQIPLGKIDVTVTDKFGAPVPNVKVSMLDGLTNEVKGSTLGDAEGKYVLETKADKQWYLNVTGFTDNSWVQYFTVSKKVLANSTTSFKVPLEPKIIGKDIESTFRGFYLNDQLATTLAPGTTYTAKFSVRVPEQKNYAFTGLHIRTGNQLLMEQDSLFIKSINAPNTAIVKATQYDAQTHPPEASYAVTNGEAKWANIVWTAPIGGVYEAEAAIKVRETASANEKLELNYRAWGQKADGSIERFPQDSTTAEPQLYNETKTESYQVGTQTLCDEEFCFQATVVDQEEDLRSELTEDYPARLFSNYTLRFTLINNSSTAIHN
ncbi:MAG: carboxypeptidase regulatory-like domain-containing protein, partial [Candidatus Diapherotrites archaeon]|nr:carboxypeptidase regulatory-like domain-containing protein [Candidatus Diapherotrites archaeon]